jgi:hypothetical protein
LQPLHRHERLAETSCAVLRYLTQEHDVVDAMGVVRLLGKQQPDKMRTYKLRPITETAEQAREAKGQKGKIAKQILLGIDAHLNGYQVCRKIDAGGLQPVQSFSLEKLLLFSYKQLALAEKV